MQAAGGATALMYACQQCRQNEVLDLMRKQPQSVKERDRTSKTPLHYCAENPNTSCAEAVLRAAPELVNAQDENGYCPLHLAVIAGNGPLIKLLIAEGADVNACDHEGHSAVHWAIVSSEREALEAVVRAGAQPSTPDVRGGYPLHYAVQMCGWGCEYAKSLEEAVEVVESLLRFGVDVNVRDRDGRQPILWAASAGSAAAVVQLVRSGACVEAADKDGLTALHCAASRGHTAAVESLISVCGAGVDVIDGNGCSALFYAVTLGHADASELLLRLGAEPNRQDRRGRTPAHCGAAKGQLETLRILQKHGGSLWLRNVKGDIPLHEAVASGRKDLVLWLLSQSPEAINIANNDGRCALHIACMYNHTEMVKVLLEAKSLVNPVMRTSRGVLMTPLNVALSRGHRGCGKYLQLHGGVPFSKVARVEAASVFAVRVSPAEEVAVGAAGATGREASGLSQGRSSRGSQEGEKAEGGEKRKVYRRRRKRRSASKVGSEGSESEESGEGVRGRGSGGGKAKRSVGGVAKGGGVRGEEGSRSFSETKNVSDLSPEDFPAQMQTVDRLEEVMGEGGEVEEGRGEGGRSGEELPGGEGVGAVERGSSWGSARKEEGLVKGEKGGSAGCEGSERQEERDGRKSAKAGVVGGAGEASCERSVARGGDEEVVVQSEGKADEEERGGTQPEAELKGASILDGKGPTEVEEVVEEVKKPERVAEVESESRADASNSSKRSQEEANGSDADREEKEEKLEVSVEAEGEGGGSSGAMATEEAEAEAEAKAAEVSNEAPPPAPSAAEFPSARDTAGGAEGLPPEAPAPGRLLGRRDDGGAVEGRGGEAAEQEEVRAEGGGGEEGEAAGEASERKEVGEEEEEKEEKEEEEEEEGEEGEAGEAEEERRGPRVARPCRRRREPKGETSDVSVTRLVQSTLRKYHVERAIFYQLLELKRYQIRSGRANEQVLVKRLADEYDRSRLFLGMKPYSGLYRFRDFESFLYDQLKALNAGRTSLFPDANASDDIDALAAFLNRPRRDLLTNLPLPQTLCTCITQRCHHSAGAYTSVPCSAYITDLRRHRRHRPKPQGLFPPIHRLPPPRPPPDALPPRPATLQLTHGSHSHVITLPHPAAPTSKRFYVTLTIKGAPALDDHSLVRPRRPPAHTHPNSV